MNVGDVKAFEDDIDEMVFPGDTFNFTNVYNVNGDLYSDYMEPANGNNQSVGVELFDNENISEFYAQDQ